MNRRDFMKAVGAVAAFAFTDNLTSYGGEDMKGISDKPNVLLIVVDDLGYGDLSCYGAKDMRTPNIDRLMDSGMRFNNFYANSPVCSPTRAALLTGRYPDMVGVPGVIRTYRNINWGYLDEDAVLLPQLLRKRQYHSAIIGKWHLGLRSPNTPNERGFDHFKGFLDGMIDDYYDHLRFGKNYMRLNETEIEPSGHATDLFTQWTCDYIGTRADKEQPFFLYLAYTAPHTPIQPPQQWLEKVKLRENNISEKRAKLVALIEHMDDGIGKIIDCLEASGKADNTLVIFVSDNGGQLNVGADNGRLKGGKEDMDEGGIKVPMCAVWPGRIKTGTISDSVNLTMDLFPTVCEAAGASIDHEIDGRSFFPTLIGRKSTSADQRYLFWVRREGNQYGGQDYYAVRYGEWKLSQNTPFEPLKLYNLQDDPLEQNPLDKSHKMYKQLFEALRDHVNAIGTVRWQRPWDDD